MAVNGCHSTATCTLPAFSLSQQSLATTPLSCGRSSPRRVKDRLAKSHRCSLGVPVEKQTLSVALTSSKLLRSLARKIASPPFDSSMFQRMTPG